MKRYTLGIDPGKSGGLAVYSVHEHDFIAVTPMLVAGKDLDLPALALWIVNNAPDNTLGCIEKVSAMPGQGVTAMFNFGFCTGNLHGILAALGIAYVIVSPQRWKKSILAGTLKDKNAAIDYCTRLYPHVSLLATERSRKPHTGISDAMCIALYAAYDIRQ